MLEAFNKLDINVPVVVRLEGTNVESAMQTLNNSGLDVIVSSGFNDCAVKAIETLGKKSTFNDAV